VPDAADKIPDKIAITKKAEDHRLIHLLLGPAARSMLFFPSYNG
jgi:hypothetical protein